MFKDLKTELLEYLATLHTKNNNLKNSLTQLEINGFEYEKAEAQIEVTTEVIDRLNALIEDYEKSVQK